MTTHAGLTARHINSYHHSTSLLFQFILAEFTESFLEIKRLNTLCTTTITPFDADVMESTLIKLVGAPRDSMRLFSWNFGEGLLAKLRTYCALLLQNAEGDTKELIALQHYADKVWQSCLQSIDLLTENRFEKALFTAALEKSNGSMQRFSKLIVRLVHQFREDENVIFYIVKHHALFDKIYGARFVNKFLSRLFPKGCREAQHYLIKRYTTRGFDHIVTEIQTVFSEIEALAV